MLNKKLYKCDKCNKEVAVRSKGLCSYCRNKEKPLKKVFKIRTKAESKKLSAFFIKHIEQIKKNPICDNCGSKLQGSHFEVAHILPKRKTGGNPEVADNENNALYLCSMILGGN